MDARAVPITSGRPRLEPALIESLPHRLWVLPKQLLERRARGEVLLHLEQGHQFIHHVRAVEGASLAHDDAFDVQPVLRTIGKRLQHDQILGGARVQDGARREFEFGGTVDDSFLERKGRQRDVERDTRVGLDEQHPMVECELAGVRPSRPVMLEEVVDEARLSAETG